MNNIDSMAEYEEQRLRRIEENKREINELNLTNLAYAAMGSVKGKKQKINKIISNNDGYIPSEEEQSSEEDETERVQTSTNLRVGSKKVMASGRGNLGKSTASMAGLLKTRSQKRLSQQREDMKQQGMSLLQMKPKENILQPPSQKVHPDQSGEISSQAISQHNVRMSSEMTLPMRSQHLVKNNNNVKKGQSKTVIAPGTLGVFLRMKEISKENERLAEQRNVIGLPMETLQRQLRSCSGSQLLEGDGGCMFGLVNNDEGSQRVKENLNTKKRQGKGKTVIAPETLGVSLCMKNKSKENHLLTKQIDFLDQSSQRHPTGYSRFQSLEGDGGCRFDLLDEDDENDGYQSSDAYGIEEHNIDPIVQKPNDSILAQDPPIDQLVSRKEKQTRGLTMCKDVHGWTLNDRKPILLNGNGQPIGPDNVTLRQFTRFYGSVARDPDLAPLNLLDWRHVPNKDNIWDYVKEKVENKPPSDAVMYKETHKRIEGRKYKTSHMEEVPDLGKNRLLGRCTKKEKQPSKSGVLIPDELLLPYKAQLLKDTVGEVMKLLKDQIPSETLASVASSLNGHTIGDVNKNELFQDDGEGDDGEGGDEYNVERNM
ncbi:hypothetical protein PHJA_000931400 [Phtheirospermum japonicum]|uniref:Uncharacterized protein n=1 Tax=Phtheirospermum japonicum TaxID=374723 RepID=A0A830BKC0_9LAMI|nr:hypothetical protein PHJA_000931400 [Phtheirospermum japonicum]